MTLARVHHWRVVIDQRPDGLLAEAPMTYPYDGKQYVVATGSANTAELVAFSLP